MVKVTDGQRPVALGSIPRDPGPEFVSNSPGDADHAVGDRDGAAEPLSQPCPGELHERFRMRERDQVVNREDDPQALLPQPLQCVEGIRIVEVGTEEQIARACRDLWIRSIRYALATSPPAPRACVAKSTC